MAATESEAPRPQQFPQDLTLSVGSVQGRIKVYVRPRPFDDATLEARGGNAVSIGGLESDEVTVVDDKGRESTFGFDHVFNTSASNGAVFEAVGRPVVKSVLCGYNGTLMAYGQTGTGKTHTLGADDGLIAQMFNYLFSTITSESPTAAASEGDAAAEEDPPEPDWSVVISYVQIYMEKVYDLLHPVESDRALALRERFVSTNNEGCIYVENVTEHRVCSAREALMLLDIGRKRLHFAETKMNRHSSRSHACCLVSVERVVKKGRARALASRVPPPVDEGSVVVSGLSFNGLVEEDAAEDEAKAQRELQLALAQEQGEVTVRARLTIVDLAGSERVKKTGAEGNTLAEAQKINLSLLELGNTIQALASAGGRDVPGRHIPFRNSTLTRLLQESLGGNCKTSLIVCISPCASDVSETKGALQFGSRAIQIKNTAVINCERDFKALAESLAHKLEEREASWIKQRTALEARLAEMEGRHAEEMKGLRAEVDVQLRAMRLEMEEMEEVCDRAAAEASRLDAELQEQLDSQGARVAVEEAHREEVAQLSHVAEGLRAELQAAAAEQAQLLERLADAQRSAVHPTNAPPPQPSPPAVARLTRQLALLFRSELRRLSHARARRALCQAAHAALARRAAEAAELRKSDAAELARLEGEAADLRGELAAAASENAALLAKLDGQEQRTASSEGVGGGLPSGGDVAHKDHAAACGGPTAANAVQLAERGTQTVDTTPPRPRGKCFGLCSPSSKVEPDSDVIEPHSL
ncbi:hypothetical protein AB1Y20_017929 [Prymnesium parvum]|uniref:Kinesin-like protein n=1 Tax=Prymnesium parvum TaxID=97485 RepID=A0AB34JN71_PRYPA